MPAEAMLTRPAFARAYATSSPTLAIFSARLTASTLGRSATLDTKSKSFSTSKATAFFIRGAAAIELDEATMKV